MSMAWITPGGHQLLDENEELEWRLSDVLERKYMVQMRRAIRERERAGLIITPQWLDAIERKYMAMAMLEQTEMELAELEKE
jgi:hypothetical protein